MIESKFITYGNPFIHLTDEGDIIDIVNGYETVPRVAKGHKGGGRWTGGEPTEKEMMAAIEDYADMGFVTINKKLRTGDESYLSDERRKNIQKRIEALDHYIEKRIEDDEIDAGVKKGEVYRGMRFNTEQEYNAFLARVTTDKTLTDNGYMSASLVAKVATDFMVGDYAALLKIESKSGVHLPATNENEESEVLFKRGSKFKITGFKDKADQPLPGKRKKEWDRYLEVNLEEI